MNKTRLPLSNNKYKTKLPSRENQYQNINNVILPTKNNTQNMNNATLSTRNVKQNMTITKLPTTSVNKNITNATLSTRNVKQNMTNTKLPTTNVKQNMTNTKLLASKNQQQNIQLSFEESPNQITNPTYDEINTKMNNIMLSGIKRNNENANGIKKIYKLPKGYISPTPICDKENCKLTKKQLCQAISENFIVRNNIIAAILTTIPYKNEEGVYEGGICFQKFKNLNNCRVCLPENYNFLNYNNIDEVYNAILEKAGYLNYEDCKKNNGLFLMLNEEQIFTLGKKAELATPEDIKYNKKLKYNIDYINLSKELKNKYFESLNLLIQILEQLKNQPLINNKTLNFISDKTKNIIDNMYNLCHYQYVFAIIALINSDIKNTSKNNLKNNILSKSLNNAMAASKKKPFNLVQNNSKPANQSNSVKSNL
jgi:hypothetical protein